MTYNFLFTKFRLQAVLNAAGEHYKTRRLKDAIPLYGEAMKLVSILELNELQYHIRYMLALCEMQSGSLRKALNSLTQSINIADDDDKKLKMMILCAEIAFQIPVPWSTTEKLFARAEGMLNRYPEYKSEWLIMKSGFLSTQGKLSLGLNLAKESLQLRKVKKDWQKGQVIDYIFDRTISLCLKLGHAISAESYLTEWRYWENPMPKNRIIRRETCLANFSIVNGDFQKAVVYARNAVSFANETDYEEILFPALNSLFESYLGVADLPKAKGVLGNAIQLRTSERGEFRFGISKMILQLRIAEFRCANRPIEGRRKIENRLDVAIREAKELDARLGCQYREKQIEAISE